MSILYIRTFFNASHPSFPFFILFEERSILFKLSLTVSKLSSFKARNKFKHKLIAMDTDTRNVSLVGIHAITKLNTVAKRMQSCCSHLRTKDMLDNVEDDV